MNDFIELMEEDGTKFLFSPSSGWVIGDKGPDKPAWWSNQREGRNLYCLDVYEDIRNKLILNNGQI